MNIIIAKIVYILIINNILVTCDNLSESELKTKGQLVFAHVIYRHGDRTPIDPYPNDPWGDLKYWPVGWGQLTTTGMQQHYELGKWLRNRYNNILINDTYSKANVYVQSTDVDRTLMSALSNLAGMFPPKNNQIWNNDLLWQPIPVHTVPEQDDKILSAKKNCPAYDYALKKYKESEEYVAMNKKYKPLYDYLTLHTGKNIHSLETAQQVYNCLFIENLYNMTLPQWTRSVYPDGDFKFVAAKSFETVTINKPMARLKTGPLIKEIFDRFNAKYLNKLNPDRTLWIYSGHDTTIANVLNTLDLFDLHSPPYRSTILFEMYILDKTPYIQISYKNTTAEPEPLYIPNCGKLCPLNDLISLYSNILPTEWDNECKLSMLVMTYEEANLVPASIIAVCVALVVLAILAVLYIVMILYRRRNYRDARWYLTVDG